MQKSWQLPKTPLTIKVLTSFAHIFLDEQAAQNNTPHVCLFLHSSSWEFDIDLWAYPVKPLDPHPVSVGRFGRIHRPRLGFLYASKSENLFEK
jgi:hypothetical protein